MTIRRIHFCAIGRSDTKFMCSPDTQNSGDEPITILVENVTCPKCLIAISRYLAVSRNGVVLDRNRENPRFRF